MATIAKQTRTAASPIIVFAAAEAGGDAFLASAKRSALVIKNDDSSSHTATLTGQVTSPPAGLAVADFDIVVAAGKVAVVPAPGGSWGNFRDPTTGLVEVTYDDVTSVSVALVERG